MRPKTIEAAARDYKEFRRDEDYVIIYEFIKKLAGIVARKLNVKFNEDVAQDSGLILITKIHQFDPEKSAFYNWAYTIVLNKYKESFRRSNKMNDNIEVEEHRFDQYSRKTKVESYTPEYFIEENLSNEDILEAVNNFNASVYKCNQRKTKIPLPTLEIYKTYMNEDLRFNQVAAMYNTSTARVKLIVRLYGKQVLEYLQQNYILKMSATNNF